MNIPAKLVKELRDRTGAGFMDAKRALVEAEGDMEKAVEVLRKTGLAKADKKVAREVKEGKIGKWLSEDRSQGVMVELACETDFVSRTDEFGALLSAIVNAAVENEPKTLEELGDLPLVGFDGAKVSEVIKNHIAKIGENIKLKRFALYKAEPGGIVEIYIHPGDMLGVMVELAAPFSEETASVARNIAMQIAATEPIAVSRDGVPGEILEKEKAIYREQALAQGKPEKVIDKIIQGRLKAFYEERVLLDQAYVREQGLLVSDYLKRASEETGAPLEVRRFVRFKVGEE